MSILDRVPEYIRSLVPYEAGKPIEEVEREYGIEDSIDRKSTRLNSSHIQKSRMPSSA